MRERGQATAEYAGIGLVVLALLLGVTNIARAQLAQPAGDAAYLDQAQRVAPRIVPEQGDDELPVDFRTCRSRSCATSGRPVLFVHAVRRDGFLYLEYWEYLPDSRTAHTGIAALDGSHADDWEGVFAMPMDPLLAPLRVPYWCPDARSLGRRQPRRPRCRQTGRPQRWLSAKTARPSCLRRRAQPRHTLLRP